MQLLPISVLSIRHSRHRAAKTLASRHAAASVGPPAPIILHLHHRRQLSCCPQPCASAVADSDRNSRCISPSLTTELGQQHVTFDPDQSLPPACLSPPCSRCALLPEKLEATSTALDAVSACAETPSGRPCRPAYPLISILSTARNTAPRPLMFPALESFRQIVGRTPAICETRLPATRTTGAAGAR